MLNQALTGKHLPFQGVLTGSWYAESKLMLQIERQSKVYYCALRCNRLANDNDEACPDQRLEVPTRTNHEQQNCRLARACYPL